MSAPHRPLPALTRLELDRTSVLPGELIEIRFETEWAEHVVVTLPDGDVVVVDAWDGHGRVDVEIREAGLVRVAARGTGGMSPPMHAEVKVFRPEWPLPVPVPGMVATSFTVLRVWQPAPAVYGPPPVLSPIRWRRTGDRGQPVWPVPPQVTIARPPQASSGKERRPSRSVPQPPDVVGLFLPDRTSRDR